MHVLAYNLMSNKIIKAKVLYATSNLSALAVFNLINALNLDIPIGKKTNDRSEFYNVELKVGEISYYGELTIFGFLLHLKN
jgi:hypothetical protein